MGKQNYTFTADDDISELSISAFNADVEICAGDAFAAEYTEGNFTIEEKKGRVSIKRKKRALSSLTRVKIKIEVPESCVPDIKAALDRSALTINRGIYGDLSVNGDNNKLTVTDAAFNIVFIKGDDLQHEYGKTTIKNAFICNAKEADILAKESFFSRVDIELKSGNVGFWETDFQMSEIKINDGNIQTMLKGTEDDYKLFLTAKNGTSNRESGGVGEKTLKCTAVKGNVIVDYSIKNKEKNDDADDNVAEDISSESGT